jgi:hypothetical protein
VPEGTTRDAIAGLAKSHVARRLNVFDVDGNLLDPESYEEHLKGATVYLRFNMEKFLLRKSGKEVFVGNIASVRVLMPPHKIEGAKKLHKIDPFTPYSDIKGKKRKIT